MSEEIKSQEDKNAEVETPENINIKPDAPDFSKMSADELKAFAGTALEAKRSANDEAKGYRLKLEANEAETQKATDDKLKEQGDYKTLLDAANKKIETLETQNKQNTIRTALVSEATKQGIVDEDGVNFIKVPDDFDVKDAKRLVSDLKKSKGYLFSGVKTPNVNSPTNSQPSVDQDTDLRPFDDRLEESLRK